VPELQQLAAEESRGQREGEPGAPQREERTGAAIVTPSLQPSATPTQDSPSTRIALLKSSPARFRQ